MKEQTENMLRLVKQVWRDNKWYDKLIVAVPLVTGSWYLVGKLFGCA